MTLDRLVAGATVVGALDATAMAAAQAGLDRLTKPPGSLGRLEGLAVTLAGITGRTDATVARKAVVVAAADHGVAARGVSAYPPEVTAQMVANFVSGGAAICVLAHRVGASLTVINVGVASEIPAVVDASGGGGRLVRARIRPGTADMTVGPAMTRAEAEAAITVGAEVAAEVIAAGVDVLAIGEMGIGNTTAASALTAALTGSTPADVTGRGTGLDDAGLARKISAVESALGANGLASGQPGNDAIGTLAGVGGLEIAALVGVVLEAVGSRIPVVVDGFIAGTAVLVAERLAPGVAARCIAAHRSVEPGHAIVLDALGLDPLLDLDLRLGEGSGAVLAFDLLDAAVAIRDRMATFDGAGVSGPA